MRQRAVTCSTNEGPPRAIPRTSIRGTCRSPSLRAGEMLLHKCILIYNLYISTPPSTSRVPIKDCCVRCRGTYDPGAPAGGPQGPGLGDLSCVAHACLLRGTWHIWFAPSRQAPMHEVSKLQPRECIQCTMVTGQSLSVPVSASISPC